MIAIWEFFKPNQVWGVVPIEKVGDNLWFEPIGSALPWAWIVSLSIGFLILMGLVLFFVKNPNQKILLHSLGFKVFGILLLGFFFFIIKFLIFDTIANISTVRSLVIHYSEKKIIGKDQNFRSIGFPFQEISYFSYVPQTSEANSAGLWLTNIKYSQVALLRWSETPTKEKDFLDWASNLAQSLGSYLYIPENQRDLFENPEFLEKLQRKGIHETIQKDNFPAGSTLWKIEGIHPDGERKIGIDFRLDKKSIVYTYYSQKEESLEIALSEIDKVTTHKGILSLRKKDRPKKENYNFYRLDFRGVDPIILEFLVFKVREAMLLKSSG
jgi:hypothetical protein